MPQPRLTVVISQGQSQHPAKRQVEEQIVHRLLGTKGIEVTVVGHLYDLLPDGNDALCLQGVTGDLVVASWLYPRAAHWTLNRLGVRGAAGQTLLVADREEEEEEEEELADPLADDKQRVIDQLNLPARKIYCLDLRVRDEAGPFVEEIERILAESAVDTIGLTSWIGGQPPAESLQRFLEPGAGNVDGPRDRGGNGPAVSAAEASGAGEPAVRRWYPVIDFSRCTNCLECIDFCLFGVYGIDSVDTILVEQPDNCRKGCPACSRVCPENAIMFPQHKTPAIAGSDDVAASLKIDLSKLFGAPGADAVEVAVRERDEQLLLAGRDVVGRNVGLAAVQKDGSPAPPDEWDDLIDQLDELEL
ncbi:MAG: ferredoxin family protein [Planctomycetales bacterium]|nr:ferredoxin family protein [Planctomycetales bacterium]